MEARLKKFQTGFYFKIDRKVIHRNCPGTSRPNDQ